MVTRVSRESCRREWYDFVCAILHIESHQPSSIANLLPEKIQDWICGANQQKTVKGYDAVHPRESVRPSCAWVCCFETPSLNLCLVIELWKVEHKYTMTKIASRHPGRGKFIFRGCDLHGCARPRYYFLRCWRMHGSNRLWVIDSPLSGNQNHTNTSLSYRLLRTSIYDFNGYQPSNNSILGNLW